MGALGGRRCEPEFAELGRPPWRRELNLWWSCVLTGVTSSVCILTYNRPGALSALLNSLARQRIDWHVIVDDGSDDVQLLLELAGGACPEYDLSLDADIYKIGERRIALGRRNVGVAGNTNRAIKLFMDSGREHVCVCNDDIEATGDFVSAYANAHQAEGVGLLCYDPTSHAPNAGRLTGLRPVSRLYGAMMSMTRYAVEQLGYFDVLFGRFGHEHCDYVHRARVRGLVSTDSGSAVLDLTEPKLQLQTVKPSLPAYQVTRHQQAAEEVMLSASQNYLVTSSYRDFCLELPRVIGVSGMGLNAALCRHIPTYHA